MPDLPTRAEVEESQRVCDAATPAPWESKRRFSNECEIVPRITCEPDDDRGCGWIADMIGAPYLGHKTTLPNAEFIAHARTALPRLNAAYLALLDQLAEKDAEIDRLLGVAADALRDNAEQGAEIERMKMEPPSWLFDCPRCGSRMRLAEMEDESDATIDYLRRRCEIQERHVAILRCAASRRRIQS